MHSAIRIGAAIVAVLVIAVVGWNLLPGSSSGVGTTSSPSPAPSPSQVPSASPSIAPSSSAVFPSWFKPDEGAGAGILPAGSHSSAVFAPGFTYTVPDGWVNGFDEPGYFTLFPDSPANAAEFPASERFANEFVMGYPPNGSPYFFCDAWEDSRGTAAEIVDDMAANDALVTSGAVDVSIGGLTGKQVDVQLDPGWTETCPGDPPTLDLGDIRSRGVLLDTADRGVIVIFIESLHSADHEAYLAEVMPVIESFQFDLTP